VNGREVERETVERTARVIGEHSAAANALKAADEHDGPVRFWHIGRSLTVEFLPWGTTEEPSA
jgi:protein-disulfide isomerase